MQKLDIQTYLPHVQGTVSVGCFFAIGYRQTAGKEHLRQLAVRSPGEYKLFCEQTHQVVADQNSQAEMPE